MNYRRDTEHMAQQVESGIRRNMPDALDGFVQFVRRYPLLVGAITWVGLFGLLAATQMKRYD